MSLILTQGLHRIPAKVHHSIQAFSKTLESYFAKSPAHARDYLDNPSDPTPAMLFGSAFHELLLEPDLFRQNYIVGPEVDKRTNLWKAFISENQGKIVLSKRDHDTLHRMAEKVTAHSVAGELLSGGEPEVTALWEYKEGIFVKSRADYLRSDNILIDVKTTTCAAYHTFLNTTFYSLRYHVQAALYLDCVNAALGEKKYDQFAVIAIEKEPPYEILPLYVDPVSIDKGRELYQKNLAIYVDCIKSGVWPGYANEAKYTMPPLWALEQE